MNNLVGTLPDSIGNLSGTFASLMLDQNLITGTIPRGIGSLVNLELLSLHSNKLVGSIPDSIGKLSKLKTLFVDQNNLRGRIPPSIGNMTSLIDLTLGDNMLEGTVPASIGNCTLLKGVHLSGNFLVGTLPEELFCLSSLSTGLLLASNRFTGPLPTQVGDLRNLGALDISENDMTAELPSTLGSCLMLQLLNLRGNQFNGTIPSSLKNLRSLQSLDLSRNNLSGQIPGYLGELPFMEYLNLSFNMFQGEVPSGRIFGNLSAVSVVGNTELCGGPLTLHLPECKSPQDNKRKRTRRVVVPICAAISIVLVFSGIFTIVRLRRSKGAILTVSGSLQLKFYPKFTYMELFQATDGFSPSNMIGEGSFGVVYKGVLPRSKEIVAVKVLKPGEWGANKSFMAECEALTNIRHRNLVKTITCCSTIDSRGNDFKAFVFEYMPNGSLDRWLHPIPLDIAGTDSSTTLSILQRLSIAIDVAEALHYLHDQCQMPILHCDLKPSNVLLDSDFSAHLGDFGLSKFLMLGESVTVSSSTGIRGTIGYVAPGTLVTCAWRTGFSLTSTAAGLWTALLCVEGSRVLARPRQADTSQTMRSSGVKTTILIFVARPLGRLVVPAS
ncbi:hypothetical protein SAY87_024013 [Trapa incisa]|uniref:Protein kinase domain-containing protein n=1 Tax=Trapa incisa TaxID=236973 RepID=A0AAN7KYS1_9MYRT|nr:hypothetical protein SAY87_024013 [Trapa incisa]